MNTIIDADSAKLAGLQIDFLQKFRQGNVTLEQFKWWLNLSKHQRDVLMRGGAFQPNEAEVVVKPKFALLVDLGVITVPNDYVHAFRLEVFREKHQNGAVKSFCYYNNSITDKNLSIPSRILHPGDKLRVRAFQQVPLGVTSFEERISFLRQQTGNAFAGAQGASLVFEQRRGQLPKGKQYASLDEEKRLWKDERRAHRISRLDCLPDGAYGFDLGYVGDIMDVGIAFFSFTEAE